MHGIFSFKKICEITVINECNVVSELYHKILSLNLECRTFVGYGIQFPTKVAPPTRLKLERNKLR